MNARLLMTALVLATSATLGTASIHAKLGLNENEQIFAAYITDWAHYRNGSYNWAPEDYAAIAKRTDVGLYSFIYFCPPAGTRPMPYWSVAPYGKCTDETEYQLLSVDPVDNTGIPAIVKMGPKVVLSVGGWNFPSEYFSKLAASADARGKFVNSVKSWMTKYGVSGVDIDWEFPCSEARTNPVKIQCDKFQTVADAGGNCPADTNNLLTLMQDLRKGLGEDALLSIASQASKKHADQMNLKAISEVIDMWHVMSYDYAVSDVTGQSVTSPNAPLYNPSTGVQMSINQTIEHYLASGVPPKKIMVGLPLYAHTWYVPGLSGDAWKTFGIAASNQGQCCGPFKATFGGKPGQGCSLCGSMMWSEIKAAKPETVFDEQTQSTIGYFTGAGADGGYTEAGTWLTYNDVKSATAVVDWQKAQGLAGTFIYSADMDTSDYEMMNAIADALGKTPAPAPQPSGPNECNPSKTCNVCTTCCQSYIPDGAGCDACVKQNCDAPAANECNPSKTCNVCTACCQSYIPDGTGCDACVKQNCGSGPTPGPTPAPTPSGVVPTCAAAGQSALCSTGCATSCRGFAPGFMDPGCVSGSDCTDPPAWASKSVCTC